MGLAGPTVAEAMRFSRRSLYSQRASSRTSVLLSEGMTLKSKLSRLLITGKRAALMRRSTMRRSRSISSSSGVSTGSGRDRALPRRTAGAILSYSRRKVGSFSV